MLDADKGKRRLMLDAGKGKTQRLGGNGIRPGVLYAI
jgi:hypothetical protein